MCGLRSDLIVATTAYATVLRMITQLFITYGYSYSYALAAVVHLE